MNLEIEINQVINSVYDSNSFVVCMHTAQGGVYWIVDVGDVGKILSHVPTDANVEGVLLTHTHFDHIYGLNNLLKVYPSIRIITNAEGAKSLLSPKLNFSKYHQDAEDFIVSKPGNVEIVSDGVLNCCSSEFDIEVHSTPGHDISCLTYKIGKYVFSGDSFIPGVTTRATLPRSEKSKVKASESFIVGLADGMTLCPGHGPIFINFNRSSIKNGFQH